MMVMRGLSVGVVVVLVLVGLVLGASVGRSEWMNPSQATAEARRLQVETDALAAKNNFDQRVQQMALEERQAVLEINRQSTIAVKAKELEWYQKYEQLKYDLVQSLALPVTLLLSVAVAVLVVGAGVFLACLGLGRLGYTAQPLQTPPSATPLPAGRGSMPAPTPSTRTPLKKAA